MKLKQDPEDFQVEELTDVQPSAEGPFAFYRLEKKGWTTPDAVQAVRRRWQLDLRRVSYGGLKDRHAHTIQYLTVFHGPRRGLEHHGVRLHYLGQVAGPYTSQEIRANRFRVTLRDLLAAETGAAAQALEEVRADGFPNYFDDQRFGSVSGGGAFMARPLLLGNFEEALRLALTAPYEYDRAPQKREKEILRACWGDWVRCKAELPRSHARSLVDYLVSHPSDFRGALVRLRPELRGLYLSAYQSHLWNRMLARWLEQHLRPEQLVWVRLRLGEAPMQRGLDETQRNELTALRLLLPSARIHLPPDDPGMVLMKGVLDEEGLQPEQLKVKGVREMFFSKGDRAGLCRPAELRGEAGPDDRHPGRQKLSLHFELPRGSYATLLVKRLTAAGPR